MTIQERFAQVCANLTTEGYRVTGTMPGVCALKHTNGNRITTLISGGKIHTLKNGHLVKSEAWPPATSTRNKPEV